MKAMFAALEAVDAQDACGIDLTCLALQMRACASEAMPSARAEASAGGPLGEVLDGKPGSKFGDTP